MSTFVGFAPEDFAWKIEFSAYAISRKRSADQQKQLILLRNNAFHFQTSRFPKNQLDPARNEKKKKKRYMPFFHENLQILVVCQAGVYL